MNRPYRSTVLPFERWPRGDQTAWSAALRPGDVFDGPGIAAAWSAATRRKTVSGYGRFLFWLNERGELAPGFPPATRITRERIAAYLEELRRTNRGHTVQNRIQELGDAVRAMAPDQDWRWMSRAAGRLRANTIPARNKRSKLRSIGELAASGFQLMAQAEIESRLSVLGRAALYRDGLIIAFLAFHPLRLRNLASLRLGHHLVAEGDEVVLKLSATETKGRRPHEAILTPRLAAALRQYLRHLRPVLLRAKGRWHSPAGDALWISKDGSPCSAQTFVNIIRKRTGVGGQAPLSPHLFRSCAATSVAIDAPGEIDVVPAILGHRSMRIGERYYNLARGLEASRAYGAMLDELRHELNSDRGPHEFGPRQE
jgi:integrase/recombinase XerD